MKSIMGKIMRFSAIGLITGLPILAAKINFAQERGERPRSVQASPDRNQRSERRDRNLNSRDSGQSFNSGRWNGTTRQWNNNFANERNRGGERDRDRNRDRDRDRDGHRRDRSNYRLGLFWGTAPYSNYYYPYDSYGQGYYGPTYGYNAGSPYDLGYSDGFSAGQFDRIQGNLYNPRQYERSGNPDYFEGFVAGYEDGYRR